MVVWVPSERGANIQQRNWQQHFSVYGADYLKSIDVEYGDRKGIISRVNQLVDTICQPVEQKGVHDLGNRISGVFKVGNVPLAGRNLNITVSSQTQKSDGVIRMGMFTWHQLHFQLSKGYIFSPSLFPVKDKEPAT